MHNEEYIRTANTDLLKANRGYFSEDIVTSCAHALQDVAHTTLDSAADDSDADEAATTANTIGRRRRIVQNSMLTNRMFNDSFAPVLSTMAVPPLPKHARLQPAMRWKHFDTRVLISFPIQTIKPKVQLQLHVGIGQQPREVEIERRLRLFGQQSMSELLSAAGVQPWQLLPLHVLRKADLDAEECDSFGCDTSRLPLEWFDDFDLDIMRPVDWLAIGQLPTERHPLPADAFLPRPPRVSTVSDAATAAVVESARTSRFMSRSSVGSWVRYSNVSRRISTTSKQYTLAEAEANRKQQQRNLLFGWVKVSVHAFDERTLRWLVTDLDTGRQYRIPRIYLRFLAEDAALFVERVRLALCRRRLADQTMKLGLMTDCMLLTGVPEPGVELQRRIGALSAGRKQREATAAAAAAGSVRGRSVPSELAPGVRRLVQEVCLDYQRTMAEIELLESLRRLDVEEFSFVELPAEMQRPRSELKWPYTVRPAPPSIGTTVKWLWTHTLMCLPEIITAWYAVHAQCENVGQMRFYSTNYSRTASLEDFRAVQEMHATTTIAYVQEAWPQQVAGVCCMYLRSIGKGWYDIKMRDWSIYKCSKAIRLMALIQLRMQQALRELVERSVRLWLDILCRPCECLLWVTDDYEWDSQNVIDSPFVPRGMPHVFYMTLDMSPERGPYYSVDPLQFEPVLVQLFERPLYAAHLVHLIDPMVLASLLFADNLYLSAVGQLEAVIADALALLRRCYRLALVPLLAYLRQYERHCEFFELDKVQYLREFKEADRSPQGYQDEILMHLRLKANLECTLPTSIQIGPFLIHVEALKAHLVNKRQEIALRLIDMLVAKLRDETQLICDDYAEIVRKLSEKPQSIEHLFATRDYMETLPDTIQESENNMRLKLFEYDILDHFWTALPNDDFRVKWTALAGPLRCHRQIVVTREMFDEETERFQKAQTSNLVEHDEKFEALNMAVSLLMQQYDTDKTTETSIEIRKLWKLISEAADHGAVLNKRQMLFDQPELDLRPIEQLCDSFRPYRTMWLTSADFLKWEEAWLGNPLPNVEVEKIRISMSEYMSAMDGCIEVFQQLPRVLEVAEFFERRMRDFMPIVDVIEWIKNPAWILLHWQELTKQTGLEIKYSMNMNFDYCISKGIMKFYDAVHEMSESATANKDALEWKLAEEERMKQAAEDEIIARKNARRGRKLT